MFKKIALITFFTFAALTCRPQYKLDKGNTQLNAGFGFSSWGLPVYAGLDHGVHKDISVGGEFSFRSYNKRWYGYRYHHNIWGFSVNGNYHFNTLLEIPKEWDLYAGLNVGFYVWSYPSDYPGDRVSGLGLGLQLGGRYYFTDKFGLNLEFGGGNAFSGGKIGISYKF